MALKDWKKKVYSKGNIYWTKGEKKENPLHLPKEWIHLQEKTPYIKKEFGENWEVHAPKRINEETVHGKTKDFKSKSQALAFVKKYMRSN